MKLSNSFESVSDAQMIGIDPTQLHRLLEIVESQAAIGGRFVRVRRLNANGGNGCFSLLFDADDNQQPGTRVALKFLYPFERSDYRRRSFNREADILSQLVGCRDIIQLIAPRSEFTHSLAGFPIPFSYYVVERASNDLGSVVESGNLSPHEYLENFHIMCRSVQRIHGRGLVHRDIKPGNFLVMEDGSLRLADFGAALSLDGQQYLFRWIMPKSPSR